MLYVIGFHSLQETFHAESSFLARVDQSDEEGLVLSTSCTLLESENSDRLVLL